MDAPQSNNLNPMRTPFSLDAWKDVYASFQGAFDTPVARRKQDDEFASDARRRMREFNEVITFGLQNYRDELTEIMCSRIKAADDAAADGDYMLDSDDCISVLRGTWGAPSLNDCPAKPEAASAMPTAEAAPIRAWMHEEDPERVISDIQKQQALRDGGASASSVRAYTIALITG